MRLRSSLCLVLLVTVVNVGCGDEDRASATADPRSPFVSLSEAESVLEDRLAVVRSGSRAVSADEVEPAPVESARYSTQAGPEFDVLVFASPARARLAMPSIRETEAIEEGGEAQRAANVVAVYPRPPQSGALRRASRELGRLGEACGGRDGAEDALRRVCFDGDAVPPEGAGADRGQAAPTGSTVTVDGLRYTPVLSRQLNPYTSPDREMVGGRTPGRNRTFFGVFLRVCNEDGPITTPTDRLALVDAFGKRVQTVGLPTTNPFAYAPRPTSRGRCIPRAGSVADSAASGALVLFEVPIDFLSERPVALEITGSSGERERVLLDL